MRRVLHGHGIYSLFSSDSLPRLTSYISRSAVSMRNVKGRLRLTVRLHVPLRSPVNVCTFHAGSDRNSSGSCMSSRNASILRSLFAAADGGDTKRHAGRGSEPYVPRRTLRAHGSTCYRRSSFPDALFPPCALSTPNPRQSF